MDDKKNIYSLQRKSIRVFISSTFIDMQAEREELIKRIFPQLRRHCESRGIVWGEVDLRWGITDEQRAEGNVLPICFAEIKNCQPFFIGILGERYGWVPKIQPELIQQHSWLNKFSDRSVTELEIRYGVLNKPNMASQSMFFFRDPAYIDTLSKKEQWNFRENSTNAELMNGKRDPEKLAAERRQKLNQLKKEIRDSGFPLFDNYRDPKTLGEKLLKHMTDTIDSLYPDDQSLNYLEKESLTHEGFALKLSEVRFGYEISDCYLEREKYFETLDNHVEGTGPPCVVTGDSGSGKSSLLANWALRHRSLRPDDFLMMHFVGASPQSSNRRSLIRRILSELKNCFDLPIMPQRELEIDLPGIMENWIHRAALQGRIILVLDGIDMLKDNERLDNLNWLPRNIPPNVSLIVSVGSEQSLKSFQDHHWMIIKLKPLKNNEKKLLIQNQLSPYGKKLEPQLIKSIIDAPQTASPLYLTALIEELRVFGKYESLDSFIKQYLEADTVKALYSKIIRRWQKDYEIDRPHLVQDALSAICLSNSMMSESELLQILGTNDGPLPIAFWSSFGMAALGSLPHNREQLILRSCLRETVMSNFLTEENVKEQIHRKLAKFFSQCSSFQRRLEELPWHLQQSSQWEALYYFISDIEVFAALAEERYLELLGYWRNLSNNFDLVSAYRKSLEKWEIENTDENERARIYLLLGDFLKIAGKSHDASVFLDQGIRLMRKQTNNSITLLIALNKFASILCDEGNFYKAEEIYDDISQICKNLDIQNSALYYSILNNLALFYDKIARNDRAEKIYREVLKFDDDAQVHNASEISATLNNLAGLLLKTHRFEEAEALFRRALDIRKSVYGFDHPDVAQSLHGLALLLGNIGLFSEAISMMRNATEIIKKALGKNNPKIAIYWCDMGRILRDQELAKFQNKSKVLRIWESLRGNSPKFIEAEKAMKRALQLQEQVLHSKHPDIAITLHELGMLMVRKKDYESAETLFRRSLDIQLDTWGERHPYTATCLNNLGNTLYRLHRNSEALSFASRCLDIRMAILGPNHPETMSVRQDLKIIRGENFF